MMQSHWPKYLLIVAFLFPSSALYGNQNQQTMQAGNLIITQVEPVYSYLNNQQCDAFNHSNEKNKRTNATAILLGTVIGGIIGKQFAKGKDKTTTTIVGTLLGGIAAYQLSQKEHNSKQDNQRCRQQRQYLVSYRHQGEQYQTLLDYQPGKSIPATLRHQAVKGYF